MSTNMHSDTRPATRTTPNTRTSSAMKRDLQPKGIQEAKLQADLLIGLFAEKDIVLTRSKALEEVAKLNGARDWNTLKARLDAGPDSSEKPQEKSPIAGSNLQDTESSGDLLIEYWLGNNSETDMWKQRAASLLKAIVPAVTLRAKREGQEVTVPMIRSHIMFENIVDLLAWLIEEEGGSIECKRLKSCLETLPGFVLEDRLAGVPLDRKTERQFNYMALQLFDPGDDLVAMAWRD